MTNEQTKAIAGSEGWNSAQVAKVFGVSVRTVDRWVDRGVLPEPFRIGRLRRWAPSEVRSAAKRLKNARCRHSG